MDLRGMSDIRQRSSGDIRPLGDNIDRRWHKVLSALRNQPGTGSVLFLHAPAPSREDHKLSFGLHHNDRSQISHVCSHTPDNPDSLHRLMTDKIRRTYRSAEEVHRLHRSE